MNSRVSSKNIIKKKRPKGKIVLKKERLNREKKTVHRRCQAGGAVFIMNSNINLRKISLSAYFKAISHYFAFNGPTRCR